MVRTKAQQKPHNPTARPDPTSGHGRQRTRLTDAQRFSWLQLIRSENVGPITFRDLINHYGGAEAALEALPELSRRGGRHKSLRIAERDTVEQELAAAQHIGAEPVVAGERGYPPWLEHIDAAPPLIYVMGRREIADAPIVAIVGSRDGSAAGRKLARTLSTQLGEAGYIIASGLARGVDSEAHSAALNTGTIAVVAGGINVVYPPEHQHLHHDIAEHGLIISERPPGVVPRSQDFPRRNRIISGISQGVVVVEAARRSGTLITARMAGEQGRDVFAIPGHPLDPRAVGTNMLLKQGATLVTCADDVLEALRPIDDRITNREPQIQYNGLLDAGPEPCQNEARTDVIQSDRDRVVSALGTAPVEIDEICRSCALSPRTVRTILLELDLAGHLLRHHNQLVSMAIPENAAP